MKLSEKTITNRSSVKKTNAPVKNHILPVLLDHLTDNYPQVKQDTLNISHTELKHIVLRDLQWLFNCNNNESNDRLKDYPRILTSTLNYGIPSFSGKRMSEIEWNDIKHALTQAILNFEPRILPEGLVIRCITDTSRLDSHNMLSIEIKGQLWCIPHPMAFLFRSDVDLENGHFELKDIG